MQSWILAHKFFFIIVILVDGLFLNYLGAKHQKSAGRKIPGMEYFWELFKQGDPEGMVACILTLMALVSGLLLAVTLI